MELRRDFSQPWDQGMPQVGGGDYGAGAIRQGMGSIGTGIQQGLKKKPMASQYATPAGPPQVGQQHPPQAQTGGANSLGPAPAVNPATSSMYQSGPAASPANALGQSAQGQPASPPQQGGMPGSPSQPKPMQQSYNPMGPVMGRQADLTKRFQQAQAMNDTATMEYLRSMGFQGQ